MVSTQKAAYAMPLPTAPMRSIVECLPYSGVDPTNACSRRQMA